MLFIPIGDTERSTQRPVVTISLIAINVAIYLFVQLPLRRMDPAPRDPLAREFEKTLQTAVEERLDESFGPSRSDLFAPRSAEDLFVFRWGYRAARPSPSSAFTYMFLHGDWLHLLGNMLFLWTFGRAVEEKLGRRGYLVAFLATGFFGTATHTALNFTSGLALIGASGAISGVHGPLLRLLSQQPYPFPVHHPPT